MSEKESEFIKNLKIWVCSFMVAVIIGLAGFCNVTIKAQSSQEQINKNTELRISATERIETKLDEHIGRK